MGKVLAKEREQGIKSADRERVALLRSRVKAIQLEIAQSKRRHPKERRAFLLKIRQLTRGLRAKDRAERKALAAAINERVKSFREWWAEVLRERKRRLDQIATLRKEIAAHRATAKPRLIEATAILSRQRDETLDALDEQQNREADDMFSRLNRAKKHLATELQDQKSMRQTARQTMIAAKPKQGERKAEFTGGVEANLTSAIELAVWKKARKQILAEANRKRVSTPDGVAELVQEYAETHQDQAMAWLQDDVETWMAKELERKGYAA